MEDQFSPNPDELLRCCKGVLPLLARRGVELFNSGEFFEAHEMLELAWREEKRPVREMYRGILQVGVACYHIANGNYRGAIKMLSRAQAWLAPFPACCQGINLDCIRQDAARAENELRRLGPGGLSGWNPAWIRSIEFTDQENAA